ncbi:FtsJ-like methyltransferase family protein [Perilla frutescens var. hirtella]|uniref:rRNA methyltransferase 2, mitochondrial n=1 Tax=Perilla frutescens var. hirtella TaxID=608512 RepID=A0AAD4P6W3_PERFH|nr:FtsJ-like methyltransferase family protein [Perilla frutescens var. frutescens]KAH6787158.1 FtsJ-like methyltransferase family protein [Perilla frutescens var. hirtella]KAH6827967.1 FtsJ-like methyltransferase family protein [Perilla frutescens var. hirtella]
MNLYEGSLLKLDWEVQLIQMQKQYKIISPGGSVLDLGCAPGAWLQVACQNLGPLEKGGVVVGIDTKKVKVPSVHCDSRVKTVCADVMTLPREQVRVLSPKQKGFSVVLSDMCPSVSGITSRDAALSAELGMRALDLAVGKSAVDHTGNTTSEEVQSDSSGSAPDIDRLLKPGGHLIIKLLESEDIKEFNQICKPLFRKASWLRPKATRSCSREIYLICQGLR